MLSIPAAVTAAAQSASKAPSISLTIRNRTLSGAHRVTPLSSVYSGSEAAGAADAVLTDSGALIRCRTDGTTVYVSRVTSPDTATSWSTWASVATGAVSGTPCALVTIGTAVAVYFNSTGNTIAARISTDDGVTWSTTDYTTITLGAAVQRLAGAVRPDASGASAGGVLLAVISGPDVRAVAINPSLTLGTGSTGWGVTAASVTGVDVAFRHDFEAIITGATASASKVWGDIYGIGIQVAADTWGTAWTIDEGPTATTSFASPTIAEIDSTLWFGYEENRSGTVARRYFLIGHTPTLLSGGRWIDEEVSEPTASHTTTSEWRLAGNETAAFLVSSSAVRRSTYGESLELDETAIARLTLELTEKDQVLTAELPADPGSPPIATAALQAPGVQVIVSIGYDAETVDVATLELAELEMQWPRQVLKATGIGSALKRHRVRQARSFTVSTKTIQQHMNRTLARAGAPGATHAGSPSTPMSTAQPGMALRPGERSAEVFARLQRMAPELTRAVNGVTYLVNPQSSDASVYTLGEDHALLESRHGTRIPKVSRAVVVSQTGIDERFSASFGHIAADEVLDERAGSSSALLTAIADAAVRHGDMSATTGEAVIYPTPALQIGDVVTIDDVHTGVSGDRRIRAITIERDVARKRWRETLELSGV